MKLLCVSGAGDEPGVSCRWSSVHPWPMSPVHDETFISPTGSNRTFASSSKSIEKGAAKIFGK